MASLPEKDHLSDIPKMYEVNGRQIPCFTAGRFEDGHVIVCFDFNGHHLEAEIMNDGKVEAFYMNRNTETIWEDETNVWSIEEWKEKLKNGQHH